MAEKTTRALAFAAALATALAAAAQQEGERVFVVRTGKATRQTISQTIRKTGGLVSPAEVSIGTKVAGRLATLELDNGTRLEEGVRVKKGDRIATIEQRDYKAQYDAALAGIASAEATMKDAKREFERASALFSEGTATAQERDQAEASYERAEAALALARAQAESAKINLDECTIYAPMDGVVSKRAVEPGTLLVSGSPIATITQIDPLRFRIAVPTTLFAQLAAGESAIAIDVDAYPGQPIPAIISRIYPVADDATRTVVVETTIPNADGRLVPGMYAVGTLSLNSRKDVLCVPYETVVRNGGEHLVYKVENGVARAVKVELGIRSDAIVEIIGDITEADEIVVAGQHRLTDGAKVKPEAAE